MTITLIYTARPMKLTIDASRVSNPVEISRMSNDGLPTETQVLRPKEKNVVPVGPGVFRVMAENVGVTADTTDPRAFLAIEVETKDPPPDPPKLTVGIARMTISMAKARLGELGVDAKQLQEFVPSDRSL